MRDIFVSYRRNDAAGVVGRMIERLAITFGKERIFRDVEAVEIGEDFGKAIDEALGQCKVFLVVIGRDWLTVANEEGERRLDDDADWVRLEVSMALQRGVVVVPVLVEDAKMPAVTDLPDDLKPLAKQNAAKLRDDPDFDVDVDRLSDAMRKHVDVSSPTHSERKRWAAAVTTLVVLVVAVIFSADYLGVGRNREPGLEDVLASRERLDVTLAMKFPEIVLVLTEGLPVTESFAFIPPQLRKEVLRSTENRNGELPLDATYTIPVGPEGTIVARFTTAGNPDNDHWRLRPLAESDMGDWLEAYKAALNGYTGLKDYIVQFDLRDPKHQALVEREAEKYWPRVADRDPDMNLDLAFNFKNLAIISIGLETLGKVARTVQNDILTYESRVNQLALELVSSDAASRELYDRWLEIRTEVLAAIRTPALRSKVELYTKQIDDGFHDWMQAEAQYYNRNRAD